MTGAVDLQQHDLAPSAAQAVIDAAALTPTDTVLEVGPGLGALTAAILSRGCRLQAIERDAARIPVLQRRFAKELADGRLILVVGDAMRVTPALPEGWRAVANPPFNLTADLLRRWLLDDLPGGPPVALDLVLQREAAQKISGRPGAHTRTSVLVALVGTARPVARLNRDQVSPPSRVDLSVWSLRRAPDAPSPTELRWVDTLLARAFAGPHTVADALQGMATGVQLRRQSQEHGWDFAEHPRMVPPPAWLPFARLLHMCGKV
ncbi:MAG: hypothetical protein H0W72_04265 [Planctomycetes bacterium]|nr:hypothetical protein [Planctomycetota bacterium]